jgi:hypothetical protein
MSLSVIVASYNSARTLERCLESLSAQPEADEIIVADCSQEDPAVALSGQFPKVRFLHFDRELTVPELRWAGYNASKGDIIAVTEARCVPDRRWCRELIRAHREMMGAAAIGGPITIESGKPFDIALYFCEYGLHSPPVASTAVRITSGANMSYKRPLLEASRDLINAGAWETLLHQRWLDQGHSLRMCPAQVVFENSMDLRTAIQQRFHYGRGYAGDRISGKHLAARVAYAMLCPLLPGLIMGRLARIALRKKRMQEYARALPWIAFFSVNWSAGEMAGYLFGSARRRRNF